MNRITADMPIRVGIWGNFGIGNLGNDASMIAGIRLCEQSLPGSSILVVCAQPAVVSQGFDVRAVGMRWARPQARWFFIANRSLGGAPGLLVDFSRAIRRASKLDLLVISGTGVLDDFGGVRAAGIPLSVLIWTISMRLTGGRVAWLNVGAGPLYSRASRRLAAWSASLTGYRTYRDEVSRRFVSSLGVPTSGSEVHPDVVFALDDVARSPAPNTPARPVVALAVMKYVAWDPQRLSPDERNLRSEGLSEILADFARWLLLAGFDVQLVQADARDGPAVDAVAEKLRECATSAAGDVHISRVGSLAELAAVLSSCHLVVATRYHSVVAALAQEVPVISIGYATKNDELMERVGLGRYIQHIDSLDAELLRAQFRDLSQSRDKYSGEIAIAVDRFRTDLSKQWAAFAGSATRKG